MANKRKADSAEDSPRGEFDAPQSPVKPSKSWRSIWRNKTWWLGLVVAMPLLIGGYLALVRQEAIPRHDAKMEFFVGVKLAERGDFEKSAIHFENAIRSNPDYPGAHFHLGKVLEQLGKPDEAVDHYEQDLRIGGEENANGHNYVGVLLARLGQLDRAAEHFERALRIDPNDAKARANLEKARELLNSP